MAAAAALLAGAAVARADLDVGVPPGTPLDWVSGMPRRIPTGTVRIPTGVEPAKKDEQPRTVSRGADVPKTHIASSDLGAVLPMSYARILTPDITRHLQWVNERPTHMVHAALAQIGLKHLADAEPAGHGPGSEARTQLLHWIKEQGSADHHFPSVPNITPEETVLRCETCHDTKDRHVGLFGKDCAACHGTTTWRITSFHHPSPRSVDCAQCHQAPPSHYMEHFHMVSKRVAGVDDEAKNQCCGPVQVNQCYRCHQTTSWNDIKGVGWYKHH